MGAENVKEKHCRFAFFTIPVMILIAIAAAATVAISVIISEEALASESTSQAAAVDNTCLNPILESNEDIDNAVGVGNCGGTVSQQDESGQASAPITSQTANPAIELQRATTTQPPLTGTPPTAAACEECFDVLTAAQQSEFEQLLPSRIPGINTIEQLCALLQNMFISARDPTETLEAVEEILNELEESGRIPQSADTSITSCLTRLYG
jgi:hypothetical protein